MRMLGRSIAIFALSTPCMAAAQSTWQLDARPRVTIGADESDPRSALGLVVGATRLPDGSVLVGERGDFTLRVFGPTGRFVRAFGRKGSGPGEVGYLASLMRCGDSLFTYDIMNGNRVSVFAPGGRYVRAFTFASPQVGKPPYGTACSSQGKFVHTGWDPDRAIRPGVHRSNVPLWLGGADGTVVRVIDSVPGSERLGTTHDGKLTGSRPLPLGKQPRLAMGTSRVYFGDGATFSINAYDIAGRRVGTLQRPVTPARVTQADIAAEVALETVGMSDAQRTRVAQSFVGMPLPTTLPAYRRLLVDSDDHLWVQAYPRAGELTTTWSVFSPTGQLLAETRAPAAFEVYEIGRDYMLGRFIDPADDIPQVRLYGLRRTGAGAR